MYIDLLIKMKNAQLAKRKVFEIKSSRLNKAVAEILLKKEYLTKMEMKGKPPKLTLELHLNPQKSFQGLRFLSRPSVRRYAGYSDLKSVKGGRGFLVLSTSRGLMTGEEARKAKLGGQLLFEIW